jgi:hypothetical protein
MGIMICPKHGRSEFVETCSHIAAEIEMGGFPSGRRFDVLGHLLVCEVCFSSLGFDKCEGLADAAGPAFDARDARWDIYDAAYAAIEDIQGFCLKCFAELEQGQKPQ